MDTMELQKTAEHVIELEARILNWRGSVREWMKELSRLRETIENLICTASNDKDSNKEAF
jgi:Flp pilus assembly CpaF family ATPase